MVPEHDLLVRIDKFLAATRMSPWAFGREALNDTNLVDDLREGRELRRDTRGKIEEFMAARIAVLADLTKTTEASERAA